MGLGTWIINELLIAVGLQLSRYLIAALHCAALAGCQWLVIVLKRQLEVRIVVWYICCIPDSALQTRV